MAARNRSGVRGRVRRTPTRAHAWCTTLLSLLTMVACERRNEPASVTREGARIATVDAPISSNPTSTQVAITPIESSSPEPATRTPNVKGLDAPAGGPRSAPMRCPRKPPKAGATCDNPALDCRYLDCKGVGEISVHCYRGKTIIETLACAAFSCGGGSECQGDQICVERESGAHATRCLANPCGTNAVTCECAGSACNGEPCSSHGRTIQCGGPCPGCP